MSIAEQSECDALKFVAICATVWYRNFYVPYSSFLRDEFLTIEAHQLLGMEISSYVTIPVQEDVFLIEGIGRRLPDDVERQMIKTGELLIIASQIDSKAQVIAPEWL